MLRNAAEHLQPGNPQCRGCVTPLTSSIRHTCDFVQHNVVSTANKSLNHLQQERTYKNKINQKELITCNQPHFVVVHKLCHCGQAITILDLLHGVVTD